MDKYAKIEKIGEGSYGVVYKAKNRKTGELVAAKKIRMDPDGQGIPGTLMREISILRELTHPNTVKMLEFVPVNHGKRMFLIFELLLMDLKKLIRQERGKMFESETVKSYLFQILRAILYCHKRGIIHRDLKPQNLLIGENGLIKISDFGLSRLFNFPIQTSTTEVVTRTYRAPELLLGTNKYYCSVDIWSIGCIFAEMASKTVLFRGDSEIDQLFRIFRVLTTPNETNWPHVTLLKYYNKDFPQWNSYCLEREAKNISDEGIDLLKKMLIYDPGQRITARDAVLHPFFGDLNLSKLPVVYREEE